MPLLIFLLLLLGAFSITGFLIQDIARMVAGPLPATARLGRSRSPSSIPLVRAASRVIARVIPKDESYAVGLGDLVGRVGEVVIGPLDQGPPGRVSVADVHGNRHFVWRSPHRHHCPCRREPWSCWSIAPAPASWR